MAFENLPYTNFHDLNLDWMLEEFGRIKDSIGDFVSQWDDLKSDYYDGIRPDYEQLREDFDDIQRRYDAMEAAWNTYKNITVPASIASQVDAAHQDLQAQYDAFFAEYSREWGISQNFGTSTVSSISQSILTAYTLHRATYPPVDSFTEMTDNTFVYVTDRAIQYIDDAPEAVEGTLIHITEDLNGAMQIYLTFENRIYIRRKPVSPSSTFGEWVELNTVHSVNGHEGDVMLNARDVGADPSGELSIAGEEYTVVKSNVDAPQGARVITFVTE